MFQSHRARHGKRALPALFASLALAGVLAGCASSSVGSHNRAETPNIGAMSDRQIQEVLGHYEAKYTRHPEDVATAIGFAQALVAAGRTEQAVAVMQRASIRHSSNREVMSAYGKVLVADGQFEEALKVIDRVQTPDRPDWRLYSAKGTILDQVGRHDEARVNYDYALKVAPGEPSVLSNLGLSYMLTGDLGTAERYLREAANHPEADSRVRQNLALVVGLKGDFTEAERIARDELSPEQAEANVAYLRQMLSQQDRWKDLKAIDGKPKKTG